MLIFHLLKTYWLLFTLFFTLSEKIGTYINTSAFLHSNNHLVNSHNNINNNKKKKNNDDDDDDDDMKVTGMIIYFFYTPYRLAKQASHGAVYGVL